MSDDLNFKGYTEEEIDKILESGDPDAIEKLMSGEPKGEDEPAGEEADPEVTEAEGDLEASAEQDEKSAASGAVDEKQEGGEEPYVESKSGGNKIPYVVLDETRKERDQLRAQNAEMAQKLAQLESSSTKMQTHLEKSGIDLSALQNGERLTDEQLSDLEEMDPTLAHLARLTMSQFERMEQLQQKIDSIQPQEALSPAELEIRANPDLKSWRESDTDRWETAKRYDDLLRQDPAFQNATLEQRFAEAVRRTKSLFGDPLDTNPEKPNNAQSAAEIAAAKVAKASASTPRTLTDMGASPQTERSPVEALGDLSEAEINARLANMSPAEIDRMLASLG